ncbi:MAG: Nif3-like dinuclear metal center hexameric protein [Desulfobacteraceae bacterium]|nr:Nif3-like dinuclear metal center hexameric protein [Desulfobacteraceae bacterium]
MAVNVSRIINIMEDIAPPVLAEAWDNVGLHIGHPDWPVRSIWVSLDPLPRIVQAACMNKVDLLITHHPLFFTPVKSIDFQTPLGSIVQSAVEHKLSIYCAHTNLDSAAGGVNEVLASAIGLDGLTPLEDTSAAGGDNREMVTGIGRVGSFHSELTLRQLVISIKKKLGLDRVLVSGDPDMRIRSAAVCSGSGSSFVKHFLSGDAQAYISGDLKYHDARDVEMAGRALIDIGHFASEHLVVDMLVNRIRDRLFNDNMDVDIKACDLESEPFSMF